MAGSCVWSTVLEYDPSEARVAHGLVRRPGQVLVQRLTADAVAHHAEQLLAERPPRAGSVRDVSKLSLQAAARVPIDSGTSQPVTRAKAVRVLMKSSKSGAVHCSGDGVGALPRFDRPEGRVCAPRG